MPGDVAGVDGDAAIGFDADSGFGSDGTSGIREERLRALPVAEWLRRCAWLGAGLPRRAEGAEAPSASVPSSQFDAEELTFKKGRKSGVENGHR